MDVIQETVYINDLYDNPVIIIPFGTNEDLAYNAQKEWESWE